MFSQICRKGSSLRSEFGHNLRHWKNSLVWSKRIWSWYRKKQGGRQQIWTLDIRVEDEKAWRNRDLQNDFEGWLPDAKPIASPAMVNSNKWRLTPSELTWQIISWINSKGSFCIPLFTATLMDIYAIISDVRARAGLKSPGLGRALPGQGLTISQARPIMWAWAGLGRARAWARALVMWYANPPTAP